MWKKGFFYLFGLMCVAGICCGCRYLPYGEADHNLRNSEKLRLEMTKADVLAIMGNPISDETYATPDLWFYYINPVWCDGLVTRDECMPLVFENGRLIGWGNDFYNKYRLEIKKSAREVKL